MFSPAAAAAVAPEASCGPTYSEAVAAAGFPSSAGGPTEAEALRRGQGAPASSEQAGAEKAAQGAQPEASAVREEELNLSVLPAVCSGLQEPVFLQTPERGSAGH